MIEVSVSGDEIGVASRRLWQELFNIYRKEGGDLGHMDNLLIDLDCCLRMFKNKESRFTLLIDRCGKTSWFFADLGETAWSCIRSGFDIAIDGTVAYDPHFGHTKFFLDYEVNHPNDS